MPRLSRTLAMLATLLLTASPAVATKPCPVSVCAKSPPQQSQFDPQKCKKLAHWVAVGRIVKVQRDTSKRPKHIKSFDTFTFQIERWEKGQKTGVRSIRFRVGWCKNTRTIPKNYSGLWRIYGGNAPKSISRSYYPLYLGLQRVTKRR